MRLLLVAAALLVSTTARGQGADAGSLRGIHHVHVMMARLSDDGVTMGLDTARFSAMVKLHLREHGIRVDDVSDTTGGLLYLSVDVETIPSGATAVATLLQFGQAAYLLRQQLAVATTWERARLVIAGTAAEARANVEAGITALLDQFVSDYRSVNPRCAPPCPA